ncbi:MAG: tetratricopeptide repeat protein [Deltaproteobacteria bacterium]|nr:tetratricopeptide repeat protein [Deltaproteobacteria bacterium]
MNRCGRPTTCRQPRIVQISEERLGEGEKRFQEGRFQESEEIFREVLKDYPNHPKAHNDLACLLWQTGRVEEALQELTKALEIAPDDRDVLWNLGQILGSMGLNQDARQVYDSYLKRHPEEQDMAEALSQLEDESIVSANDQKSDKTR